MLKEVGKVLHELEKEMSHRQMDNSERIRLAIGEELATDLLYWRKRWRLGRLSRFIRSTATWAMGNSGKREDIGA